MTTYYRMIIKGKDGKHADFQEDLDLSYFGNSPPTPGDVFIQTRRMGNSGPFTHYAYRVLYRVFKEGGKESLNALVVEEIKLPPDLQDALHLD